MTGRRRNCKYCSMCLGNGEAVVKFRGDDWHQVCLITEANQQLKLFEPEIRVAGFHRLSERIVQILESLAPRKKAALVAFQEMIDFCVDFLVDAARRPAKVPMVFQASVQMHIQPERSQPVLVA